MRNGQEPSKTGVIIIQAHFVLSIDCNHYKYYCGAKKAVINVPSVSDRMIPSNQTKNSNNLGLRPYSKPSTIIVNPL